MIKTIRMAILLIVLAPVISWQPAAAFEDAEFPLALAATGDALFDRYAQAVYERQEQRLFTDTEHHPATLDDEVLVEWESEFAGDPRYWQLRFWCVLHRDAPTKYVLGSRDYGSGWEFDAIPYAILTEAIDRDADDWVTLWLYLKLPAHQRSVEMDALMEELPGRSHWTKEQHQQLTALHRQQEQAELAELDSIVDAAPDQSWPYYYRAAYWMEYGETDKALADLRQGNAAPLNELPTCFPASFVIDGLEQGEFRGSQVLCGAILDAELSDLKQADRLLNSREWRDFAKNISTGRALGQDTDLLNEFHRFSCRYGTAQLAYPLEAVVAADLVLQNTSFELVDQGSSRTVRQRAVLLQACTRARQVSDRHSALMTALTPFIADHAMILPYLNLGNVVVSGGSSYGIVIGRTTFSGDADWEMMFANTIGAEVYEDLAWVIGSEYELHADSIRSLFEELAAFNYDSEDPPPGWYVR